MCVMRAPPREPAPNIASRTAGGGKPGGRGGKGQDPGPCGPGSRGASAAQTLTHLLPSVPVRAARMEMLLPQTFMGMLIGTWMTLPDSRPPESDVPPIAPEPEAKAVPALPRTATAANAAATRDLRMLIE